MIATVAYARRGVSALPHALGTAKSIGISLDASMIRGMVRAMYGTNDATGSLAGPGKPVKFNGVKVFSATMVADRDQLGEKITAWMASHQQCKLTDVIVTQSSDEAFHCLAITLFFWEEGGVARR